MTMTVSVDLHTLVTSVMIPLTSVMMIHVRMEPPAL